MYLAAILTFKILKMKKLLLTAVVAFCTLFASAQIMVVTTYDGDLEGAEQITKSIEGHRRKVTRATLPSLAKIKTIRNLNNMKFLATLTTSLLFTMFAQAEESKTTPKALNDRLSAKGWKVMGEKDFAQVNCNPDTFQFKKDGTIHCTGKPSGGLRSAKVYKNFEVVFEWRGILKAKNYCRPAGSFDCRYIVDRGRVGNEITVFIKLTIPAADRTERIACVFPNCKRDMNAIDVTVMPLLKPFTTWFGDLQTVDYQYVIYSHG